MSWENFIEGKNPDDIQTHQEFLKGGIKKRGKFWTKLTQPIFDSLYNGGFYTFLYYDPADLVSEETVTTPDDLLQPGEDLEFYYILSSELTEEYVDTEEEGTDSDSESSSDSDMEGLLANPGLEAAAAKRARRNIMKNPESRKRFKQMGSS